MDNKQNTETDFGDTLVYDGVKDTDLTIVENDLPDPENTQKTLMLVKKDQEDVKYENDLIPVTKKFKCRFLKALVSEDARDHHYNNLHLHETQNESLSANDNDLVESSDQNPISTNLHSHGHLQQETYGLNLNVTPPPTQTSSTVKIGLFHGSHEPKFTIDHRQPNSFCAEPSLQPIDLSMFSGSYEQLIKSEKIKSLLKCLLDMERDFISVSIKIKVETFMPKKNQLLSDQRDISERHGMFRKILKREIQNLLQKLEAPLGQPSEVQNSQLQSEQVKASELQRTQMIQDQLEKGSRNQLQFQQNDVPNDWASKNAKIENQSQTEQSKKIQHIKEKRKTKQSGRKQSNKKKPNKKQRMKRKREAQAKQPQTVGMKYHENAQKSPSVSPLETFLIPLIKVDRLDQHKLNFLNEIGVASLVPLQEISKIGTTSNGFV